MRHARLAEAVFVVLATISACACRHAGATPAAVGSPRANPESPAACTVDADCRIQADYCGGCGCHALSAGEQASSCEHPVRCFADPCSGKSAACRSGACIAR